MPSDQDHSRNAANPSIFVIQTKGSRGTKALEKRLDPFSGGSEAGHFTRWVVSSMQFFTRGQGVKGNGLWKRRRRNVTKSLSTMQP